MSKDINITVDSEINESPQGFGGDDSFNENDSLNFGNEFYSKNELQSKIFQDIELPSKKYCTDYNINETIPSSVYEDLDKMYIGKKTKKKNKDNTDIQNQINKNMKGRTISKSKAININKFKNISDNGTTKETSNQKDKIDINEND